MNRSLPRYRLGLYGAFTLVRLSILVLVVTLAIKKFKFKSVLQKLPMKPLKRWFPSSKNDQRIINVCTYVTQMIERRKVFTGTCLSRSIVLWSTLKRYGIESCLRIGIKRGSISFAAHAWVEIEGRPINAPLDVTEQYQPFTDDFSSINTSEFKFTL